MIRKQYRNRENRDVASFYGFRTKKKITINERSWCIHVGANKIGGGA